MASTAGRATLLMRWPGRGARHALRAAVDAPYELFVAGLHHGGERRCDTLAATSRPVACGRWPGGNRPRGPRPANAAIASKRTGRLARPAHRRADWPNDFVDDDRRCAALDRRCGTAPGRRCCSSSAKPALARSCWRAMRTAPERARRRLRGGELCALPADLFEAELFGYVGGAFTDARREGSRPDRRRRRRQRCCSTRSASCRCPCRPRCCACSTTGWCARWAAMAARRVDDAAAGGHPRRPRAGGARAALPRRPDAPAQHRAAWTCRRCARSDFAAIVRFVLDALWHDADVDDAAIARLAPRWSGQHARAARRADARLLARPTVGPTRPLFSGDAVGLRRCWPVCFLALKCARERGRRFERCGNAASARTSRSLGISRTTVHRYLRQRLTDAAQRATIAMPL